MIGQFHSFVGAVCAAAAGVAFAAALGAAPAVDPRDFNPGWRIPDENYGDEAYLVVTKDGKWLCPMTPGQHRGSQ